jgi:hypothetical protein
MPGDWTRVRMGLFRKVERPPPCAIKFVSQCVPRRPGKCRSSRHGDAILLWAYRTPHAGAGSGGGRSSAINRTMSPNRFVIEFATRASWHLTWRRIYKTEASICGRNQTKNLAVRFTHWVSREQRRFARFQPNRPMKDKKKSSSRRSTTARSRIGAGSYKTTAVKECGRCSRTIPATEIKPRSLRLASLVFGVENFK